MSDQHQPASARVAMKRGANRAEYDPAEIRRILEAGHIAPIWDTARPPNESDLKQTLVLSLALTEASAKVRGGDPIDDEADMDGPHWAGVVPLTSSWGTPIPASDLRGAPTIPAAVTALDGTDAHR